jgi:hypothetical protein
MDNFDFERRMASARARVETQRAAEREPPAYLNEVPPIGADEAPLEPIEFIDMSEWDSVPVPPREWSVHDHIPLKQPTLFSGEGAGGKSLLMLQLSAAHVLARPWLGLPAELGPAIYVGAEDDKDEIHRRVANVAQHYDTTFSALKDGGLHLLSLAGEDARTGTCGSPTFYGSYWRVPGSMGRAQVRVSASLSSKSMPKV